MNTENIFFFRSTDVVVAVVKTAYKIKKLGLNSSIRFTMSLGIFEMTLAL